MKSKFIHTLIMGGLLITACTSNFDNLNSEDGSYDPDKQVMDNAGYTMYFNSIQQGIYFNYNWGEGTDWTFQTMQNLGVDMFAGYFHDMASKFAGENSVYNMNDGWNSSNWSTSYSQTVSALNKAEDFDIEVPQYMALIKIYRVATMHRLTDQYGPILYENRATGPVSQENAYKAMFADLDDAISLIDQTLSSGIEDKISYDILMRSQSTYSQYAKWANSLRLRLAIRVSNVNSQMASEQAKKALSNKYGVLETNNDIVEVSTKTGYKNPLGTIGLSWWEVYMNASLESFMVGYDDPRTDKYFTPSVGGLAENSPAERFNYTGMQKGIPQGYNFNTPKEVNHYKFHSRCTITADFPAPLMTPAEVWLLRAEAALRGYSTENVKDCYEKGVRLSFEQWGASGVDTYLASDAKPTNYKDVFFEKNDMKAMSTITPKWNESASNEEKLERIITQKWLAIFPEGAEAWAEQRRTGYPKLFKTLTNQSGGTIDTDKMVRRLPFPANLKTDQPELYKQLVDALGGQDNGGTDLWWSVGQNKF